MKLLRPERQFTPLAMTADNMPDRRRHVWEMIAASKVAFIVSAAATWLVWSVAPKRGLMVKDMIEQLTRGPLSRPSQPSHAFVSSGCVLQPQRLKLEPTTSTEKGKRL
jgi:negative regulator of sigma E activity